MTDFLWFFSKIYYGLPVYTWLAIIASFFTIIFAVLSYLKKQKHAGNKGIIAEVKGKGSSIINIQHKK